MLLKASFLTTVPLNTAGQKNPARFNPDYGGFSS